MMKTPTNPIPPATLEMMRQNLTRRVQQHADLGDDRGAEKYRRLVENITRSEPTP